MAKKTVTMTKARIFKELGLSARMKGASVGAEWFADSGDVLESRNPTTGELLARIEQASAKDYDRVMKGKLCKECGNETVIKKDGCDFCTACGAVGACG